MTSNHDIVLAAIERTKRARISVGLSLSTQSASAAYARAAVSALEGAGKLLDGEPPRR